jgi:hypothetical protein
MKRLLLAITALAIAPAAFAQATDTGTSTLSVTVAPEASFSAAFTGTTLSKSGTKFEAYTGTTNFTFKIRTTQSGGSGSVTLAVTNFSTGGPALNDLTYTCTAAVGTACSGTVTATNPAATVIDFGADAHSADAGSSGSISWSLVDRTTVKTGDYSSTATFTISAS